MASRRKATAWSAGVAATTKLTADFASLPGPAVSASALAHSNHTPGLQGCKQDTATIIAFNYKAEAKRRGEFPGSFNRNARVINARYGCAASTASFGLDSTEDNPPSQSA